MIVTLRLGIFRKEFLKQTSKNSSFVLDKINSIQSPQFIIFTSDLESTVFGYFFEQLNHFSGNGYMEVRFFLSTDTLVMKWWKIVYAVICQSSLERTWTSCKTNWKESKYIDQFHFIFKFKNLLAKSHRCLLFIEAKV